MRVTFANLPLGQQTGYDAQLARWLNDVRQSLQVMLTRATDVTDQLAVTQTAGAADGLVSAVPVRAPLGTAALPSYSFVGDNNTGMFSPGADAIAWAFGGAERIRATFTGLGVGLTPTFPLDVFTTTAAANATGFARFGSGSASNVDGVRLGVGYDGVGVASGQLRGPVESNPNSGLGLFSGNPNLERLRVKALGAVRFVPLASAPASPEAGDVYYDSGTNKLRCHNGTTWNDLF